MLTFNNFTLLTHLIFIVSAPGTRYTRQHLNTNKILDPDQPILHLHLSRRLPNLQKTTMISIYCKHLQALIPNFDEATCKDIFHCAQGIVNIANQFSPLFMPDQKKRERLDYIAKHSEEFCDCEQTPSDFLKIVRHLRDVDPEDINDEMRAERCVDKMVKDFMKNVGEPAIKEMKRMRVQIGVELRSKRLFK